MPYADSSDSDDAEGAVAPRAVDELLVQALLVKDYVGCELKALLTKRHGAAFIPACHMRRALFGESPSPPEIGRFDRLMKKCTSRELALDEFWVKPLVGNHHISKLVAMDDCVRVIKEMCAPAIAAAWESVGEFDAQPAAAVAAAFGTTETFAKAMAKPITAKKPAARKGKEPAQKAESPVVVEDSSGDSSSLESEDDSSSDDSSSEDDDDAEEESESEEEDVPDKAAEPVVQHKKQKHAEPVVQRKGKEPAVQRVSAPVQAAGGPDMAVVLGWTEDTKARLRTILRIRPNIFFNMMEYGYGMTTNEARIAAARLY